MSGDINVQTFSGKVNISNNLKVGSGHLFVDTLNNQVGLNTNDPQANLHVNGNTYVHTNFRVGSGIIMNETSGRITAGSFVGDGSALQGINSDSGSWVNGVSSNVHLATTGDSVGIGVVDPQYKLDVAGDINITSGSTLRVGGTPAVFSNWTVSGSDIYRSSGNVGIGTTTPGDKLELHATGVGDNIGMIVGNGDRKYRVGVRGDTDDNFTIQDDTVGSMRMVIDTSGNVGIGTTSPQTNLHIESSGNTGLDIYGGDTNNPYIFIGEHASSYSRKWGMKMNYYGDSNTEWFNMAVVDDNTEINALTFRRNGNVGIGTQSPSRALDVSTTGSIGFGDNIGVANTRGLYWTSGADYSIYRTSEAWSSPNYAQLKLDWPTGIVLRTARGTYGKSFVGVDDRMSIGASYHTTKSPTNGLIVEGNVGIGTSSPAAKLHVNGGELRVTNADTAVARIALYGSSQGTGQVFVGQSAQYGGGIEYNGDNSPTSTGAGADYITLYRVNNNTYDWTARNSYASNNWEFRGNVKTPLLDMNGTTMSKAPRVIHIDDSRSGCPPTQAANTPIMQYNLVLARTAYVYVSVTTILNYTARADCQILFGGVHQQSHLTAADNTNWNPVCMTAGGTIGAGTTNIQFRCTTANVVGCQSDWGGMQILVFEQ